jgi:hypothetical protein
MQAMLTTQQVVGPLRQNNNSTPGVGCSSFKTDHVSAKLVHQFSMANLHIVNGIETNQDYIMIQWQHLLALQQPQVLQHVLEAWQVNIACMMFTVIPAGIMSSMTCEYAMGCVIHWLSVGIQVLREVRMPYL